MDEAEFKQAIQDLEPLALRTLANLMKEGGQFGKGAAETVLAYSRGKPEQKTTADLGITVNIKHFGKDSGKGSDGVVIEHAPQQPKIASVEEF